MNGKLWEITGNLCSISADRPLHHRPSHHHLWRIVPVNDYTFDWILVIGKSIRKSRQDAVYTEGRAISPWQWTSVIREGEQCVRNGRLLVSTFQ